jgi:two-component system CheB/CheR fusion protein
VFKKENVIIAIGASAGGFNALRSFITSLSGSIKAPVIFMQHLPLDFKSVLPELLKNQRSDFNFVEIKDGMSLEPATVYLSVPGKDLVIEQGVFKLSEPQNNQLHFPIDRFFSSLAKEYKDRVVAVILSGTGVDGTLGCLDIRESGGTVFVQEPSTAEFDRMPRSVIDSSGYDQILPPEKIAAEIEKIIGAHDMEESVDGLCKPEQFSALCDLLYRKTGFRFNNYKESVIMRRILRRIYLHGFSSVEDYLSMLASDDLEAKHLAIDFMIGVTSFFRDYSQWEALRELVVQKLISEPAFTSIRIWVPACATGEEAYSVAMLFKFEMEKANVHKELQVFATDINENALERGREGRYPLSVTSDIAPEYLNRFFTFEGDRQSIVVKKELRELVVFAKQDVLRDPPFSKLDLIICRNLLIYFTPDAQEKCFDIFHYSLLKDRFLFLGTAENPGKKNNLFRQVDSNKTHIYQRITTGKPSRLSIEHPIMNEVPAADIRHGSVRLRNTEFFCDLQEDILEKFGPAVVVIDKNSEVVYQSGPVVKYLTFPRGPIIHNFFELISDSLSTRLRSALYKVTHENTAVSLDTKYTGSDGKQISVRVLLSRVRKKDDLFLIAFEEETPGRQFTVSPTAETAGISLESAAVHQLESELAATRDDLQKHIEQLRSMNEEMQSSNEELQASNEELETSREELKSLNEELISVNSLLQEKMEQVNIVNNDLTNLITSTNIPTLFLDQQFRICRFTPAITRLIKLVLSDIGRKLTNFSTENLGAGLLDEARVVLEDLTVIRREIRINDSWYIRSIQPYRTGDNRIDGAVITYVEISGLKKAQTEAEEGRRRLYERNQLLEHAPVLVRDLNDRITLWTTGMEKLYGFTKEDAVGKISHELFHTQFPAPLEEIRNRVFNDGRWEGELRHIKKDGKLIIVNTLWVLHRDYDGNPYSIIEVNAEITRRKQMEEELRESEQRLSFHFENSPLAVVEWNSDYVITQWSKEAERMFGWEREEVLGKRIDTLNLIFPDDISIVEQTMNRLSGGAERTVISSNRNVTKSGKVIACTWYNSVLVDENSRMTSVMSLVDDVTEQKRAQRALRESEERLTIARKAAGLGIFDHDISSPVISCDERVKELWGIPFDKSFAFEEFFRKMHPDDREKTQTAIEKAYDPEGDGNYCTEYRVIYSIDQKPRWISVTGKVFFDSRKAARIVGTMQDITEQKNAQLVFEKIAAQHQLALDSASMGWWHLDPLTTIVNTDNRFKELFGLTSGEFSLDDFLYKMLDPKDLPGVRARIEAALDPSDPKPYAIDYRIRRPDGIERWIEAHGIASFEGEGESKRAVSFVGTVRDITERKQADEAIRISRDRFALLARTSSELLQTTEPQKQVESLCRSVMEYLDCHAFFNFLVNKNEDRLHLNAYYGIPQEEAGKIEWLDFGVAVCGCAAAQGCRIVAEHIPQTDDPRTALVKSYGIKAYACHPLFVEGGRVIGTLSFGSKTREIFSDDDLSLMKAVADQVAIAVARMEQENEIRESEERFRTLANAIPNLAWIAHADGYIYWYNKRWYEYTGTTAEQMEGWGWQSVHDPDELPYVMAAWKKSIDTGEHFEMEFPLRGSDGVFRTFLTRIVPFKDSEGRVIQWFGTNTDITEQRRIQENLQRRTEELADANRELEAFSSSVSHDLRAPLRSMKGFSEFLLEDYGNALDKTGHDYIDRIINSANRMNTIIEDMLALAKISRQQISITEIDLSAMARLKIKELREMQPDRSVEVLITDGITARGDSHLINLAIGNLLNNAWKYTSKKENPKIEFGDVEKDGQKIYYVKDNGAGFDPKLAGKLFVPFQRLHSDKEFAGTGIGLAIVERAIKRNGGKVWAVSEIGKGAVFYFTINCDHDFSV